MSIERAKELRKNLTDAEQRLWGRLKQRQLHGMKFRRQQPIGPFIVDFVCFERRVIVEVDGGQHAERSEYDSERTRWLQSRDYRVLRFWNNKVLAETDTVTQAIADALIDTPTLILPRKGGGNEELAVCVYASDGNALLNTPLNPPPQGGRK